MRTITGCETCKIHAENNAYLRDQVRLLNEKLSKTEDKLLSLAGDAADRYHRLKLTEAAQMNPSFMDGAIPREETRDDTEVFLDNFINGFNGN